MASANTAADPGNHSYVCCNAAHPAPGNSCALLTSTCAVPSCCVPGLQPKDLPPLRLPAAKRLVAIGDLHGDLSKVRGAAAATAATAATALVSRVALWQGLQEGTATAGAATLLLVAGLAGTSSSQSTAAAALAVNTALQLQ
jgi:hypothetical protein